MINPYILGASAAVSPWVLTDIDGCVLWLRSDLEVTHDGDPTYRISQTADQSGEGNHLTQSVDAKKYVLHANQINGYPSIRSDGVDDFMECAGASLLAAFNGDDHPYTIFYVNKELSNARIWTVTNSGWFIAEYVYGGTGLEIGRAPAGETYIDTGGVFNGAWNYSIHNFTGATVTYRRGGVVKVNAGALDTATFGTHLVTFYLTCLVPGVQHGGQDFAEFAVWNRSLTVIEEALLETYAAGRYFP